MKCIVEFVINKYVFIYSIIYMFQIYNFHLINIFNNYKSVINTMTISVILNNIKLLIVLIMNSLN